jgi:hypothetical protein
MDSLAPFLVLLLKELAGNVSAVCLMERDCMTLKSDPFRGQRWFVEAYKARAKRVLQYDFANTGTLSVPWLIKAVGAMTEPLLPFVEPEFRKYLFIGVTWLRTVQPLYTSKPHNVFNSYKKAKGLPGGVNLSMFRAAETLDEFERTGDPLRAKARARHGSLRTTKHYLDHPSAHVRDGRTIAVAQRSFLKGDEPVDREALSAVTEQVNGNSHACTDPSYSAHGTDVDGFCANLLWPLNSSHFVFRFEPRPVAFLLRDYDALLDARKRLPPARFAKRHGAKLRLIEDLLLEVEPALQEAGRALIPAIPRGVRLD